MTGEFNPMAMRKVVAEQYGAVSCWVPGVVRATTPALMTAGSIACCAPGCCA